MKIIFDDLAKKEFEDAIEYYEIEISGLGIRFKNDIKKALKGLFSGWDSHHTLIF